MRVAALNQDEFFWFSVTSPCSPGKVTGPLNVALCMLLIVSPTEIEYKLENHLSITTK